MPSVFGRHMVLQQEAKIPVWGWAAPDEKVTVTFGRTSAETVADASGNWRVALPPMPTNSQPLVLTVQGVNTLRFDDVLVGDVWVCSGQSNMGFNLKYAHNAAEELPKADDPQLRLFFVDQTTALEPQQDVKGRWAVCTPSSVGNFSAVGYFFGRDLRKHLQRPVGLIGTYWGGTKAESWTSLSGLKKEPPFTDYITQHERTVADFTKATAEYPQKQADHEAAMKAWKATGKPAYDAAMKQWKQVVAAARAAKQPEPRAPINPEPKPPTAPDGGPRSPVVLFNGMVAPLIPYAIKGAIWYQGESNVLKAAEYATLFPRMINDWREKWGAEFPFLFVQLAALDAGRDPNWPFQRESQAKALALPKTGMAVAVDVGDPHNIHPAGKSFIGQRLALAARHVAYGQGLVYSGPTFDSMKVEDDNAVLSFKHLGSGLMIGETPWLAKDSVPASTTELQGFVIAGQDRAWKPAIAKINGDHIIVSSPDVPKPVAVRYAFENNPLCNLYNKEHLPAVPFRTDDWQSHQQEKKR